MSLRLAKSAIVVSPPPSLLPSSRKGAASAPLRPTLSSSTTRCVTPLTARFNSNVPTPPPPQEKAQSIVDSLPGNSLVSKAAVLSGAAGLSIAAISNEIYVLNNESVIAFSLLSVFYAVAKYGGPMYKAHAEGEIQKYKDILNASRVEHTEAVKRRIGDVQKLGGVVDTTKELFELSKETALLETKAYEMEQRTAVTAEAKRALDSWVAYEAQVKQREQRELAETVIGRVQAELKNPRTLQTVLQQSVGEVERVMAQKA